MFLTLFSGNQSQVRVQSDPAGRLVISGEPEHPDNPWGVTAFKKVQLFVSSISITNDAAHGLNFSYK